MTAFLEKKFKWVVLNISVTGMYFQCFSNTWKGNSTFIISDINEAMRYFILETTFKKTFWKYNSSFSSEFFGAKYSRMDQVKFVEESL